MFIIVYLSVFIGIHTLFFFRVRVLFTDKGAVQGLVMLFLALMLFVPMASYMLERAGHDLLARTMAFVGFYWMGFIFYAFVACLLMGAYDLLVWGANSITPLVSQTRFSIPSLSGKMPALVMMIGVSLLCVYGAVDARNIRVERLRIETDKLLPGIDSLTIAQISDVHLGLILRSGFLETLLTKLEAVAPDILACTGDFVDGSLNNLIYLTEYFERLHPPYGKYAVTGNHEYYAGLDKSLAFLKQSGFIVLRGESKTIPGLITIAGVDDSNVSGATSTAGPAGTKKALDALSGSGNGLFTLFLKHRPDVVAESLGRFDLQLSGHTHRGQMFPFNYLVKRQYPLMDGLHELGKGSKIYISRGTGTWGPPMRVFSPPEITLIELVRRKNDQ